jgi:hypothetical protein
MPKNLRKHTLVSEVARTRSQQPVEKVLAQFMRKYQSLIAQSFFLIWEIQTIKIVMVKKYEKEQNMLMYFLLNKRY